MVKVTTHGSTTQRSADYVHGGNFTVASDGTTVYVDGSMKCPLYTSLIQYQREPLSLKNRFFEVVLQQDVDSEAGQYYMIGTNVVTKEGRAVWDMYKSIRFRSLEGGVFTEGTGLNSNITFGHKGDHILVYLEQCYEDKSLINFFLNGTLVFRQWINTKPQDLQPAIGVDRGPAKFFVTWPGLTSKPRIAIDKMQTYLCNWVGYLHFIKDDDNHTITLTKHDSKPRDGFNVQAPRPFTPDRNHYFEVTLLTQVDDISEVGIGLSPGFTCKFQLPGSKPQCIGYHANSGKIFNESYKASDCSNEPSRVCQVGDTIGCGVVFRSGLEVTAHGDVMVIVYFTRNGEVVYTKPRFLPQEGFYPTIGMLSIGEQVKVNFSSPPSSLPSFEEIFSKWVPLYTNFRFSEVVNFIDYEETGTANKLDIDAAQNQPNIVQHMKEFDRTCYFCLKIDNMDEKSQVQIGMSDRNIVTQTKPLYNPSSTPAFILFKKVIDILHIDWGDSIDVIIETVDNDEMVMLFWTRNRLVQRNVLPKKALPVFPTVCVAGGDITLDVSWPDDDKLLPNSKPIINFTTLSNWIYHSSIQISDKQMVCQKIEDQNCVYNVISPFPLTKDKVFFFQLSYVTPVKPKKVLFPGLGLTSGTSQSCMKADQMLNDMWTVLFFASTHRLITWKGSREASDKEAGSDKEAAYTTVSCSAAYQEEKGMYQLRFYCDSNVEVSTDIEVPGPVGGYYPVFSFQKGTQGQMFSTDLIITRADGQEEEESEDFQDPARLCMTPGPEKLYNWRDEDMNDSLSDDDVVSINSTLIKEKQSFVSTLYISHCQANIKEVQSLVTRLEQKGYTIQTTGWNRDDHQKLHLEMAQIIILCLSPAATMDEKQKQEFDFAIQKDIPVLPLILQTVSWPPSGLYKSDAVKMEKFTDVKLDFSGRNIIDRDIIRIEKRLKKAISLAGEPIELGPVPRNQDGDADSETEADGKIQNVATYISETTTKLANKVTGKGSRSCNLL